MTALLIAECTDEKRLLRLIREIFPSANPGFGRGNIYLIAEFEGEDAGFLHIILHEKGVLLQGIGVREKFRKKGIGNSLMDAAIGFADKKNKDVLLKVKPSNTDAINLYAKKGFTIKKLRDVYILEKKQFT